MMILFVDDEQAVLDGLVRSLFHLADEWDIETATSGEEALEILAEAHFDVVVTDMRMPGMDGAELLTAVHDRYPETVRIVLSGHTEQEAAMRAAKVAHQFLIKPCSAEDVEAVVHRANELRNLLAPDALRSLVGHLQALPSVPRLYKQLSDMLEDEACGINEVSTLIESDPAMCAKSLQLVNTSFFGIGRPISRVHDAVSRLGLRMVRNLAMMSEVFGGQENSPLATRLEQEAQHALMVGILTARFFEGPKARDDAFMVGMLHDVGKIVLWQARPTWEEEVSRYVAEHGVSVSEAERQTLGATHGEVGAYLLGVWGLPNPIVSAVAFHEAPGRPTNGPLTLMGAVHIADALARGRMPDRPYRAHLGSTEAEQDAWRAAVEAARESCAQGGS